MKKKLSLNKETMAILNTADMSKVVGQANVECPPVDAEFAVLLPHEDDCSLFYQCKSGTPVLMQCSGNLHFDPELNVCTHPEYAKCRGTLSLFGNCETTHAKSCYLITVCF